MDTSISDILKEAEEKIDKAIKEAVEEIIKRDSGGGCLGLFIEDASEGEIHKIEEKFINYLKELNRYEVDFIKFPFKKTLIKDLTESKQKNPKKLFILSDSLSLLNHFSEQEYKFIGNNFYSINLAGLFKSLKVDITY